ncbi:inner membrane protein YiaA [Aliiglaciecola sp. 3_MG-2023]|uniref:inner membrane protein YiaA n=1 Tax=Aliiglaciecola sp. 3_MG-2023 TaxID=3062644 RepID=UPI0026E3ECE8|nr:inner membrane protein YiaA [Aliiglaciecola sp. 3_MG-2023]MDO6693628.1 inner membrane protein YiaA [Aliiglaciecola sp. 3_MG-2023]
MTTQPVTTSMHAPTKSYTYAAVAALIIGIGAYGVGLFNAQMLLNEKGYYLITLLYGLFSTVSLQKNVRDKAEGINTSSIYSTLSWLSSGLAIGLLVIGLINADLLLSEKGFYAMAYTLSLFAAVTVQKNVRDKQALDNSTAVEAAETTEPVVI